MSPDPIEHDTERERVITPEHVGIIKGLLHDIVALWHGFGEIRIVIKGGTIYSIEMSVIPWIRGHERKN